MEHVFFLSPQFEVQIYDERLRKPGYNMSSVIRGIVYCQNQKLSFFLWFLCRLSDSKPWTEKSKK